MILVLSLKMAVGEAEKRWFLNKQFMKKDDYLL
jgi:hypothetical protein